MRMFMTVFFCNSLQIENSSSMSYSHVKEYTAMTQNELQLCKAIVDESHKYNVE